MIKEIRKKLQQRKYEYSKHSVDQSILRHITTKEVLEVIENGKIIEDYPDDKYGPSCLIYGKTELGRHVHVQCTYPSRPLIKIITLYDPDIEEWEDYAKRRK